MNIKFMFKCDVNVDLKLCFHLFNVCECEFHEDEFVLYCLNKEFFEIYHPEVTLDVSLREFNWKNIYEYQEMYKKCGIKYKRSGRELRLISFEGYPEELMIFHERFYFKYVRYMKKKLDEFSLLLVLFVVNGGKLNAFLASVLAILNEKHHFPFLRMHESEYYLNKLGGSELIFKMCILGNILEEFIIHKYLRFITKKGNLLGFYEIVRHASNIYIFEEDILAESLYFKVHDIITCECLAFLLQYDLRRFFHEIKFMYETKSYTNENLEERYKHFNV
jgi:hypothetical protein